jgi:Zn ribbon nucleic-acid-binding protein
MGRPGPGPNALCLRCWSREDPRRPSDPTGYFDVPCLRHGIALPRDYPVRVITEEMVRAILWQGEDRFPSITCPRCGLVSYHAKDIEHRYCARCGFHDDL